MIDFGRLIVPFISPFPISLAFLIAGLALLYLNKRKAALLGFGLGIGVLLFFGYGIFTKQSLYHLERCYVPLVVDQINPKIRQQLRYVIVLGSGHISDPSLPTTAQIGGSSLYRLIEGIRICRLLPESKLVISGGTSPWDPVANAKVVSDVALRIGIAPEKIIIETQPKDTYEEAEVLKDLLGKQPFVLVTSAVHMKRAMKIFITFGMQPLPAPTDFILKDKPGSKIDSWLPNCGNLGISQRVIYEWMGEIWGRLKSSSENSR
jgi:uncharacterized SAM-binding protein YcdF (DUF218 family)